MSSSENGVFTQRSVKIAYRLILTDSLNEIKSNKEILNIHSNKIKISSISKSAAAMAAVAAALPTALIITATVPLCYA